jgi:hypothetical protein
MTRRESVEGTDFVSTIELADATDAAPARDKAHPWFLGRMRPWLSA